MADQRHGYNVSVGYVAIFFPYLAPDWLDFCIGAQGYEPQRAGPSYRYIDLGCGQGFHLCLLAAANPQAEFVGIDFDAEHITHAEELAAAGGLTNVRFIQGDFLELAKSWPAELGTFDYMALQGILTWVSAEIRAAVFQCVAHASKPGTLASFGYNTPPGWLGAMPFQHVANRFSKSREATAAIGGAIAMFRRLKDAKSQFFERQPNFKADLETFSTQPASYLAHEFLPDGWSPLWHSEVARDLSGIDFAYVGPANPAEALLPNALPPELAAIIKEQIDPSLREDVQDITIVQRFRQDIFSRGPNAAQSGSLEWDMPIHLMNPPKENAPLHFRTCFGGLIVDYKAVSDILAAVADGPKPAATLMALENPARLDTRSIILSMLDAQILTVGTVTPGSPVVAERFNAAVARAAVDGKLYMHVAAAALGSGAPVTELDLLLLDTWFSGEKSIAGDDLALGVARRLRALGRKLQFRGSPVPDEQLDSHMTHLVPIFFDQLLPKWRTLGIVA